MNKMKPNFHETYAFLKRDLSGPRRIWRVITAKKEQVVLRARRDELQAIVRGEEHKDIIKDEILDSLLRPKDMPAALRASVLLHRKGLYERKRGKIYDRGTATTALNRIARQYFEFNVERFEADFDIAMMDELTDRAIDDELAAVKFKITELRLPASFDSVDHFHLFFTRVQTKWKGVMANTVKERRKLAERILLDFVADYQARAPLFDVPVSVNGVAIGSMHGTNQKRWAELYESMKLEPGYSATYYATRCDLPKPDEVPLTPADMEDVPEPFKEHIDANG